MPPMSKEYMIEYRKGNKEKLLEQQKTRDDEKRAVMEKDAKAREKYLARRRQEYLRLHPEARTMEQMREEQRLAREAKREQTKKVATPKLKSVKAPVPKKAKKEELPVFKSVPAEKPKVVFERKKDMGWILICGSFVHGSYGMTAWVKDGILKMQRTDMTATYMIMGDKSGKVYANYIMAYGEVSRMQRANATV